MASDARLPGGAWGLWEPECATIWVDARLEAHTPTYVATLAHETIHAASGHAGHQPDGVEDRIDEVVAACMVDPDEYAYWESEYGCHAGGIAAAMGLPRGVVAAYRRHLARTTRPRSRAGRCD